MLTGRSGSKNQFGKVHPLEKLSAGDLTVRGDKQTDQTQSRSMIEEKKVKGGGIWNRFKGSFDSKNNRVAPTDVS
jgi:hypothetical protein